MMSFLHNYSDKSWNVFYITGEESSLSVVQHGGFLSIVSNKKLFIPREKNLRFQSLLSHFNKLIEFKYKYSHKFFFKTILNYKSLLLQMILGSRFLFLQI